MLKRSSRKRGKQGPEDVNEAAFRVASAATGDDEQQEQKKNPAAVALGRLGGLKGGPARAKSLTAEERSRIARKAAKKRWRKASK